MQCCVTFRDVTWYLFYRWKFCKCDIRFLLRHYFGCGQQLPLPTVIGCCVDSFLPAPCPHWQATAAAVLYSCRPLLQLCAVSVFQLCACHPDTSNMTVTERCKTFRYLLSHACLSAVCFVGYIWDTIEKKLGKPSSLSWYFWRNFMRICWDALNTVIVVPLLIKNILQAIIVIPYVW